MRIKMDYDRAAAEQVFADYGATIKCFDELSFGGGCLCWFEKDGVGYRATYNGNIIGLGAYSWTVDFCDWRWLRGVRGDYVFMNEIEDALDARARVAAG
jgi:hypothetical protein